MATQWIRSRQTGRANRLLPGGLELRPGTWHQLADPRSGTAMCGKRIDACCNNPQRRSSEPPEGDTKCRVCAPASAAGPGASAAVGGAS